jgi:hypothetical protein
MNPWITNFILLVISNHKSRVGALEARQWACSRFTSVVCGKVARGKSGTQNVNSHEVFETYFQIKI